MNDEHGRRVERETTIAATREAVWQALTEAAELTRWFPFQANVTPGVGGRVWYSWDGAFDWEGRITIWEPTSRLQVSLPIETGHDAKGRPDPSRPLSAELTLDFHLETARGGTRVRLVHAGFGRGADWDDEFDGVDRGWQVELLCLKHYLERHAGQNRVVVWAIAESSRGPRETWARVVAEDGVLRTTRADVREGSGVRIETVTGDTLEGTVLLHSPGLDLVVELEQWNRGIFRASLNRLGNRCAVHLWLAAWGVDRNAARALGERLRPALEHALAESALSSAARVEKGG